MKVIRCSYDDLDVTVLGIWTYFGVAMIIMMFLMISCKKVILRVEQFALAGSRRMAMLRLMEPLLSISKANVNDDVYLHDDWLENGLNV